MLNKMCPAEEMLAVWHSIRNEEQVLWTDLGAYSSPCLGQILYIDITQIPSDALQPAGGNSVGIQPMTSDPL